MQFVLCVCVVHAVCFFVGVCGGVHACVDVWVWCMCVGGVHACVGVCVVCVCV